MPSLPIQFGLSSTELRQLARGERDGRGSRRLTGKNVQGRGRGVERTISNRFTIALA